MSMAFIDKVIYDWGVRCFGAAHMQNRGVRALRFFEEAIELCQAIGLSKEQLHKAIDIVYSRPRGDWKQEIGGCRVTLTALCEAADLSCDDLYLVEVQRCLGKSPEHFAKRNAEKIALGLDTVDPTRTDRVQNDMHRPAPAYPRGGELWRHGPLEETDAPKGPPGDYVQDGPAGYYKPRPYEGQADVTGLAGPDGKYPPLRNATDD